jgi:hypothetical protein
MTVLAKRPHESHWAWRSRLMALAQQERDRNLPLITPELESRGWFADEFVMHVETGTKAQTKRRRQQSSLAALRDNNQLTNDQLCAAVQIAAVVESIRRNVSVRSSSIEARVDCAGSAHNALIEQVRQVQLERTFRLWHTRLWHLARPMLAEMIVSDQQLKETARRHRFGWPRALRLLQESLDRWNEIMQRVTKEIDDRDVQAAHRRLAA